MKNPDIIPTFTAVFIDPKMAPSQHKVSVTDICALALDYGYAFTRETVLALESLSAEQRGTLFIQLGDDLAVTSGNKLAQRVSPLYRDFPNHKILSLEHRWVCYLLYMVGIDVRHDPRLYGADPVTGFQDNIYGADTVWDALFAVKLEGGDTRRAIRFLKLADDAFISGKVVSMLSNLTPFSPVELRIASSALSEGRVKLSELKTVRFREKLPLLWDGFATTEMYSWACNSVTDVLRLAAQLSNADVSLQTSVKLNLSTSHAKLLLSIMENILADGNTDFCTDLLRHDELWKRFAAHVRTNKYVKRFPLSVTALIKLRKGNLVSWESDYARADLVTKIGMARKRPGVFVRRLAALCREAITDDNTAAGALIMQCADEVFPQVDCMKLLQLFVHMDRTVKVEDRFHMLPNGKLMHSVQRAMDHSMLAKMLEAHLSQRLGGMLEWSNSPEMANMFIPAANRAASDTSVRTSRGDRVQLKIEEGDVVRFFLFWHHRCDVDISAVFYDENMVKTGECAYYEMRSPYARHSGDILDGSSGAAEYIDVNVDMARKHGARYVQMQANVYTGQNFDTFECAVGVMIRDGKTGRHFEASTVETKLSLDSATRACTPAILDLETQQMIYVDLPEHWGQHENVARKAASLAQALQFFVDYADYRPSFDTVLRFAGTPDGSPATVENIRGGVDEVLAMLSAA